MNLVLYAFVEKLVEYGFVVNVFVKPPVEFSLNLNSGPYYIIDRFGVVVKVLLFINNLGGVDIP